MARLLEAAAKELLARAGISVPDGRTVETVDGAVAVAGEIGYPVALKAQVPVGGRGKAGGILFADTAEEAATRAEELFAMRLHDHPVERLLVERRLEIGDEHYLGVISNPATRSPTLVFSRHGGVDVEVAAAKGGEGIARLDVDLVAGVRPFMAIEMLGRAGMTGRMLMPLARMATRLFEVYRRYDCLVAEINPVAMTPQGPVALDARIAIDDDALFRHRNLGLEAGDAVGDRAPTEFERIAAMIDADDHRGSAHFIQIDPDGALAAAEGRIPIGFDGIGTGVSLATMDELVRLGFQPKNFCDTSGNPTASKLYRITRVILSQPDIEGYVFASCLSSQQLDNTARGIVKAFKEIYAETGGQPNLPCVLSFRGAWDETALALFEDHGIADSPWVRLLGRDSTERDLAVAFRDLHAAWRAEHGTEAGL